MRKDFPAPSPEKEILKKVIQQTLIEYSFSRDLCARLPEGTEAALATLGPSWKWQINLGHHQHYDVWGCITLCWGGGLSCAA